MIYQDLHTGANRAAQLLKEARFVVAFTGAGISTASGIPDFRSPDCGLWNNVDPMAVASIYGFRHEPEAFYKWVHPLAHTTLKAQPNPAHRVLARWEAAGYLQAVITQNIDMLHTRAGSRTVYELHGHMREATCIQCFAIYPGEPIILKFIEDGKVPRCPKCGGILKPNVILFGEQLPHREFQASKEAARRCDLMLVIGSSLEVAPASDIPVFAQRTGAKLIVINLEPTPVDSLAEVVMRDDAARVLPEVMRCLEALA